MKTLGVVGGLGPMATAYFMQLVTAMTDAGTDQEHMEMLIHSKPQIPDRTGFIVGKSNKSPLPDMISVGKGLKAAGADLLAIPCITAHYFQDELERDIGLPVIHTIEETAKYLQSESVRCVGIMATDGTITSKLFQKTFDDFGIETVLPDMEGQNKVMHIIYDNVKANRPIDRNAVSEVSGILKNKGAELVLLGCTELSMIKRDLGLQKGFLDVMEVLARVAVTECATLKMEYQHLISE